jgi:hypothetical protein
VAPHFRGKPVGEEFGSVGGHNERNGFFASLEACRRMLLQVVQIFD